MGRVAVVTGAGKGIGAATAEAFGRQGYEVIVNYLSDETGADRLVKNIQEQGSRAVGVQADMFSEEGVERLFQTVEDEYGRLDVLVNNVGSSGGVRFGAYTIANITDKFIGNVASAMLCTQRAVPLMQEGGSVLFNSSINGMPFCASPDSALYGAGKAALGSFAQAMAEGLAPKGIRCNVVAPGFTKTPVWDRRDPYLTKQQLAMTLQDDFVTPEEVASTFVFLAETPHITAQTVVVDAGLQKRRLQLWREDGSDLFGV